MTAAQTALAATNVDPSTLSGGIEETMDISPYLKLMV